MRALRFLLVGLMTLSALSVPATAQETVYSGPELWLETHEDALDDLLDETATADPYVGTGGSCVREDAVGKAKAFYGDDDASPEGSPVDCVAPQCFGWPPRLYVNEWNCIQMIQDLLDASVEAHYAHAGP